MTLVDINNLLIISRTILAKV